MTVERAPPLRPQFEPLGEAALLLRFGDAADAGLAARLQALAAQLGAQLPAGVQELVPSYAALALHFDPLQIALDEVAAWVRARLREKTRPTAARTRLIEIPVCYGGEFGPDLALLASHSGLSESEVISRHTALEYVVAMIGFLPGFPYLLGLDEQLSMPRMDNPRAAVPAGAVGIGGAQTGIYPQASPGGWRLIARTPLRLFDARRSEPSLLRPGDRVRFAPVTASEFERLAREAARP